MNEDIKNKVKLKHKFQHRYLRHKRKNEDFAKLEDLCNDKTYWLIMKTFFNGKKVFAIPPLLFNSAFVTDFQEKTNIFSSAFAKRCTLISNKSVLPSELMYMTEERIHSITFIKSDVIKIIRALDVNKAHGHDKISLRMIKLCTNSVADPLTLIFQNSLVAGTFATQ